MSSPLTSPLLELADAWRSATALSRRRVAIAGASFAWVVALLVARQGTVGARLGAAAAMSVSVVVSIGWRVLDRRRLRQPARIVERLVRRAAPERADRAIRALSLVGPSGEVEVHADGTSAVLARLHVARSLAQLPAEQIVDQAARTAARLSGLALVGLAGVLAIVVARSWSLLEGADVLVARHGIAPVTVRWLDDVDVMARPPDYLREAERRGLAFGSLGLPYGTLVTVRGMPVHPGRRLLLTNGAIEIPFVEDGAGGVVARWPVTDSTTLRVIARFGAVTISGAEALAVESIADSPPIVRLDGAPRQVMLVEQGAADIPIKYDATDDHGLREVHLVLRSGTREERRVLAHLDSQTTSDKGGYLLRLRDTFLRESHVPIEVTVEAKDNDPLTGPKWGASAAIVLVPPHVGEPEALRMDALRRLRDAIVDSLAWRLSTPLPDARQDRSAFLVEDARRASEAEALLSQTLTQAYAGIRVPVRSRATLLTQAQAVRKSVDRETKLPSLRTQGDVVKATEHFALVVDAVVRGLGLRDSRDSALQLADVADDLALGAGQDQRADRASADRPERGQQLMDAATTVLAGGSLEMKRLGILGRDLGEIVDADLARVQRSRDAADLVHAELAARDLAARLREPDPSFGARGGSVGRAGGESGGARGSPGDEETQPEDVDRAFQEAAKDVGQLAQDHAGEVVKMEQALGAATSDDEADELRRESSRHAEAIRAAANGLPSVGNGSDSWTSKGAAARELAEQMARSLEQARAQDAVQGGRSALGALDEARRILQRGGWFQDPSGEGQRRVERARSALDAEEKWVEQRLEQMRKRASERARKELQQGGDEEGKLADRARELAQQGRDHGSLPQKAIDAVADAERSARQAAEALREGDGQRGLDRQHEAQRSLEAANEQLREEDEPSESSSADSGEDGRSQANPSHGQGNVPKPGKGPDEFRRRVVQGLGQPTSGALKDAVRRYAEGLLR